MVSRSSHPFGVDPFQRSTRTPGPLGVNDAAHPGAPASLVGDTPGSLGKLDAADPRRTAVTSFKSVYLASVGAGTGLLLLPKAAAVRQTAANTGRAFVDTTAHPRAPSYYALFPDEPLRDGGWLPVAAVTPIPGMTLEVLLTQVVKSKAKRILVVCHGHGGGLSIPLVKGSSEVLGITSLDTFADNLSSKVTNDKAASALGLTLGQFSRLRDLVVRTRHQQLELVVLRSCVSGAFPDVMEKLKAFFGAKTVDAPQKLDAFGYINVGTPTTNPAVWEKWLQDHPGAKVEGSAPHRFAWTDSFPVAVSAALADSSKGIQDWVLKHFPPAKRKIGTAFPYHALVGANIVFPNDTEFRAQLASA